MLLNASFTLSRFNAILQFGPAFLHHAKQCCSMFIISLLAPACGFQGWPLFAKVIDTAVTVPPSQPCGVGTLTIRGVRVDKARARDRIHPGSIHSNSTYPNGTTWCLVSHDLFSVAAHVVAKGSTLDLTAENNAIL